MRALVLLLVLLAGMARAETVSLTSGEHDGFTRIVVDLSEATPWQVGRTPDGYTLRLGREGIRFDVTQVFRNIPRTRLASIWADPATGDLQLGIGCACHAMPFEFRKNVIVIDLKDGPPPAGSSFEQTLDGRTMPKLAARDTRRPKARPASAMPPGFNWTQMRTAPATATFALPVADVEGLREQLLQQLSRGAAQGLLNLTLPPDPISVNTAEVMAPRTEGQVRSGFNPAVTPGIAAMTPSDPQPALTPQGSVCIEDARLDLPSWADARPFAEQLAEARGALVGEFDRPDADAVGRQVRLLLHFGFGLEARATLSAFAADPPDAALWTTMALIVDGEPVPPANPFAEQEDCDTAAALWAVLARPELRRSDRPDAPAVLRSFSGLPLWLRRNLGPDLAGRFLTIGDTGTARSIQESILRAPGNPGHAARLAKAQLDMADGETDRAVAEIEQVTRDAGPMLPQAMIDLVAAQIAQGATVDAETVEALEALVQEQGDAAIGPALRRAEGLARASGGDFATAFAMSRTENPGFDAELWPLLADRGPDSALLAAAVLAREDIPPTPPATALRIAQRLLDLGFPDAALAWLPPAGGDPDLVLLAARAALMRQDARAALRLLAGQTGAAAESLRAEAATRLGDSVTAASAFSAAGQQSAADRAAWRGQDWAAVAEGAADPALVAAAALASTDLPLALPLGTTDDPITVPQRDAPLARGRALIVESAAARATVLSMLAAVPAPEIASP